MQTASTEMYTYGHTRSRHDALPMSRRGWSRRGGGQLVRRPGGSGGGSTGGGVRSVVPDASRSQVCPRGDRQRKTPGRTMVSVQPPRSEEHTSELQSLMRIPYAVFCLKNKIPEPFAYHLSLTS